MKYRYWLLFCLTFYSVGITFAYALTSDTAYQAGLALYNQGQWQQAVEEEKEAVRLDPNNWQAFQIMGYSYQRLGNETLALEAFESSLGINPDNQPLEDFVNTEKSVKQEKQDTIQGLASLSPQYKDSDIRNTVFVQGGVGFPLGPDDFRSGRNIGYSFGLGAELRFSPIASFVVDVHYNDFTLNTTPYTILGLNVTGSDLANLLVLANIKARFAYDMPVQPYFIAGLGISELWKSQGTLSDNVGNYLIVLPQSQTDFAFRFGLGIDIMLNNGNSISLESDAIGAIVQGVGVNTGETEIYDITNLGFNFDL